jgi:hypothetical protein
MTAQLVADVSLRGAGESKRLNWSDGGDGLAHACNCECPPGTSETAGSAGDGVQRRRSRCGGKRDGPCNGREQLVAIRGKSGTGATETECVWTGKSDCLNTSAGDYSEMREVTGTCVGCRQGVKVDRVGAGARPSQCKRSVPSL